MCGIIGTISNRPAAPLLLAGLRHVEYRGYDSAGIATIAGGNIQRRRAKGKLDELAARIEQVPIAGTIGIGHTRWATHGAPTEENAHPHFSADGRIALAHNGIIENMRELRELLAEAGLAIALSSETDTEVLAFLIGLERSRGAPTLAEAVRRALLKVEGAYGIAVISADDPDELIAARNGSPLAFGKNRGGEWFVGSDPAVFIEHARHADFLENGEILILHRGVSERIERLENGGEYRASRMKALDPADILSGKDGYEHFMLKELRETPSALARTLAGRIRAGEVKIGAFDTPDTANRMRDAERIVILACGTSLFAGQVGKLLIERFARIPTEAVDAAEWRYGERLVSSKDAVIAVSQSGETADTLEALKEAKKRGALVFGITNRVGSALARETEPNGLYLHAGPEIAVASTKAFACQVGALALFAAKLGLLRRNGPAKEIGALLRALQALPRHLEAAPAFEASVRDLARVHANAACLPIIGRGFNAPVASEGALKLWELPYIAGAHGFAGGALKHGPIALLEPGTPVIAIMPRDSVYAKMKSNVSEALARGADIIALTTGDTDELAHLAPKGRVRVIRLPETAEELYPIPAALVLQYFAYYAAAARGTDVDQPRNLAKSVTVE